jgi:hypothetical protein
MSQIAISEEGYVGIYQAEHRRSSIPNSFLSSLIPKLEWVPESLIVLHVNQITGYELLIDNKSGLGGAIASGLLFGGGGAVVVL